MNDILIFLKFYIQVLFYPIGVFIIFGLVVALFEKAFHVFTGKTGRFLVIVTSVVGTPIHELGHALMCILFGHKITAMSLWQPNNKDGLLGYVEHTYNKRNPYQLLGNLFIGLGPIFSGLLVIFGVLSLCFPMTLNGYMTSSQLLLSEGNNLFHVFVESLKLIPSVLSEGSISIWLKVLGIIIILSVCLHINLSPMDIKGSMRSIPIYLALCLIFSLVMWLLGENFVSDVVFGLKIWSLSSSVLYMIVVASSLSLLVLAFVFFIIRKIFGK